MKFDYNYMQWREDTYKFLDRRSPVTGQMVQEYALEDTDDYQLTERERLMCIFPVIKWVIEHDMLTKECKTELRIYYREYNEGKFDGLLGDDEADEIRKDLFDCYHKVFGE